MRRQFLLSALLAMMPALTYAQTISAVWDPNPPEDQITGYQVCIGTTPLSCNVRQADVPAAETSYDFTPDPGVLYRVAVRAVNTSSVGSFTPEVTASVPALVQPANQTSTVNVPISPLSMSASDPDGSTLRFTHSGLPFGLSLDSTTGIITGTPTSAGSFSVTVFVADNLATASRTFTWTVQPSGGSDATAPTLTITSHASGQTVTTSSITLAGTASDSGSGGSGITSVTVNGSPATGGSASGSNTANWSRSVSLLSGANTFNVVAFDGAGNARSTTITINRSTSSDTTAPTLAITSHSSGQTLSSATVTLSGTATDNGTGGSGISSVTVNGVQASSGASGNNTATWSRTLTLPAGTNVITVIAADGAGNVRSTPITLVAPTASTAPATAASLTADRVSPQPVGTTVTLSATAGGGVSPYSFKWWAQLNGGAWTLLRDWSGSSLTWTPTVAGTYTIGLWVRSYGATADAPQTIASLAFAVTSSSTSTSSAKMIGVYVTGNRTSPQPAGTTITLTVSGSGGAAPFSYKWWAQRDGGSWALLQDWTTNTTLNWTPSQSGSYVIGVWGRSAPSTADTPEAVGSLTFGVSGSTTTSPLPSSSGAMTSAWLTASAPSPQLAGSSVTFAANGSGGATPYAFKWWVQRDGGAWALLRDWSTNTTFTWTPKDYGTYVIGVWGRSAGATADLPQVIGTMNFVISDTSAASATPPPSSPMTSATLTSDRPAVMVGTTAMLAVKGTGGTTPYSFKWWAQRDGGAWTLLRDWSTSTSLAWSPAAPGTYVIGVWARSAGATADVPQTIGAITLPVYP